MRREISLKTRRYVHDRAGHACQLCGWQPEHPHSLRGIVIHHIIFVKDGGSNDADNLICLCDACHKQVHGTLDYSADDLRLLKDKAKNNTSERTDSQWLVT